MRDGESSHRTYVVKKRKDTHQPVVSFLAPNARARRAVVFGKEKHKNVPSKKSVLRKNEREQTECALAKNAKKEIGHESGFFSLTYGYLVSSASSKKRTPSIKRGSCLSSRSTFFPRATRPLSHGSSRKPPTKIHARKTKMSFIYGGGEQENVVPKR